jgi:hypothetical protein
MEYTSNLQDDLFWLYGIYVLYINNSNEYYLGGTNQYFFVCYNTHKRLLSRNHHHNKRLQEIYNQTQSPKINMCVLETPKEITKDAIIAWKNKILNSGCKVISTLNGKIRKSNPVRKSLYLLENKANNKRYLTLNKNSLIESLEADCCKQEEVQEDYNKDNSQWTEELITNCASQREYFKHRQRMTNNDYTTPVPDCQVPNIYMYENKVFT